MRELKPETQIKKQMEAFIYRNGLKDTDITIDGVHYFLVSPNKLGQGYIKIIDGNLVWSADLKKNDPTKVTNVKNRSIQS